MKSMSPQEIVINKSLIANPPNPLPKKHIMTHLPTTIKPNTTLQAIHLKHNQLSPGGQGYQEKESKERHPHI
jgi:hypothetical protein